MQSDSKTRQWTSDDYRHLLLIAVILFFTMTLLWRIEKDLPFAADSDESTFVTSAARIATSGDLNPRFFGTPGSTTIYPLALMFHSWHALRYEGTLFRPDSNLGFRFGDSPSEFYLIGRLLSVAYSVATIIWIYIIGECAFGSKTVGLISGCLAMLYPVTVSYSQWVRTDTSALFFSMLALWLCLLVYDSPTVKLQLLAGLAIGLAIASRYFMVTLAPVFLAANLLAFLRDRPLGVKPLTAVYRTALGLAVIGLTFFISTPYFFLDFETVVQNLRHEARDTQLGWDGLSPLGNLRWYVMQAIPQNITWPQMVLAIAGAVIAIVRREVKPILLLMYIAIFLLAISLSPLHWARWVIQILPLFSLFAVYGLLALIAMLFPGRPYRNKLAAVSIALMLVLPFVRFGRTTASRIGPSTRLLAREWVIENVPNESKIVIDKKTAPLADRGFLIYEQSWSPPDRRLDEYISDGYQYIVVNGGLHESFLAEADRYATQLQFYDALQREAELLTEIVPTLTNQGKTIRIYRLPDSMEAPTQE